MRSLLTGALTLFTVACVAPAAAQAAPCDGIGAEQPFLDWHDSASYVLVAGGDFESATDGWTLTGGAAVTGEGNPFRPASSTSSLSLPDGASATTPATCVAKGDPVARIFNRTVTSGKGGPNTLKTEILYLDSNGEVRKVKKAGALHERPKWAPSRRFSLAQGQFSQGAKPPAGHEPGNGHGQTTGDDGGQGGEPKPARTGEIQLRFTALAGSSWLIDDVFIDPHARR